MGDRRYLDPMFDAGTNAVMSINANALDVLGIRADWGARIQAGEKPKAAYCSTFKSRGRIVCVSNQTGRVE